jgi:hypothetical protein
MTFPTHDEIRIRRLPTGYLIELCKDGTCHTKLFDSANGVPGAKKTIARLMELCEPTVVPA